MKQPIALSIRSADLKINRNFFLHSIEHQLAESPYLPRKPLNLFSTIGRRRRGSSCCLLPLGTRPRGTCSSFPWLRTADRHKQARISPILLLLRSRFKLLRPADLSSPTPSRVIIMVQFKNRYLVIEVLINGHKDSSGNDPIIITEYNLLKAIKDSIMLNFGECGLALSLGSLQVKYANPSTKLCIIRTSRDDYQMIWSAMTMVKSIGKCPIALNLLVLSGTLKACKSAALKCEEAKFDQYKLEAAGNHLSPEKLSQIRGYIERINTLEN